MVPSGQVAEPLLRTSQIFEKRPPEGTSEPSLRVTCDCREISNERTNTARATTHIGDELGLEGRDSDLLLLGLGNGALVLILGLLLLDLSLLLGLHHEMVNIVRRLTSGGPGRVHVDVDDDGAVASRSVDESRPAGETLLLLLLVGGSALLRSRGSPNADETLDDALNASAEAREGNRVTSRRRERSTSNLPGPLHPRLSDGLATADDGLADLEQDMRTRVTRDRIGLASLAHVEHIAAFGLDAAVAHTDDWRSTAGVADDVVVDGVGARLSANADERRRGNGQEVVERVHDRADVGEALRAQVVVGALEACWG